MQTVSEAFNNNKKVVGMGGEKHLLIFSACLVKYSHGFSPFSMHSIHPNWYCTDDY